MPRDSPLLLYAKNHAKIEFYYGLIAIMYKYMLYFITKTNNLNFFKLKL